MKTQNILLILIIIIIIGCAGYFVYNSTLKEKTTSPIETVSLTSEIPVISPTLETPVVSPKKEEEFNLDEFMNNLKNTIVDNDLLYKYSNLSQSDKADIYNKGLVLNDYDNNYLEATDENPKEGGFNWIIGSKIKVIAGKVLKISEFKTEEGSYSYIPFFTKDDVKRAIEEINKYFTSNGFTINEDNIYKNEDDTFSFYLRRIGFESGNIKCVLYIETTPGSVTGEEDFEVSCGDIIKNLAPQIYQQIINDLLLEEKNNDNNFNIQGFSTSTLVIYKVLDNFAKGYKGPSQETIWKEENGRWKTAVVSYPAGWDCNELLKNKIPPEIIEKLPSTESGDQQGEKKRLCEFFDNPCIEYENFCDRCSSCDYEKIYQQKWGSK